MNKYQQNEKATSGKSESSTQKSRCSLEEITSSNQIPKLQMLNMDFTEMDGEYFYHWDATRKIMEIIRRRNNSPETRILIEQRNELSWRGTLRRRYDVYTERTIFAPSGPNKRSREEKDDIDAEIIRRANRLGGGYQPIIEEQEKPEKIREEGELEMEAAAAEEDSVIMRGDNLPIVDLSKHNTEGKEAHYDQINHIVGKLISNKKKTEDHLKRTEFEFMMVAKTLIAKMQSIRS